MSASETQNIRASHIGPPDFFRHIRWSAQPDIAFFDIGSLPVLGMRHYRTAASGTVEILADAPEAEDWDALLVSRNGTGTFGIDFCGKHSSLALHRDLCCFLPAGADSVSIR